jgi:membrane-anchored glycerophosphoryl diester phosphodiesterase (GDPDase)
VLLNGLAVGVGSIFLIVPGIYLLCRLIVCLPVALVEKLGASESLSRSFQLTRDNAGRAFMILLVFFAVSLAGGAMTGVVLIPITLTHRDPSELRIVTSASMVLQMAVSSLVAPVLLIASSVFYFDLRIRKEAFDLQFMMNPDSEHITRQQPPGSIL